MNSPETTQASADRTIEYILDWDSKKGWESDNGENRYFIIDFKDNVVYIPSYGSATIKNNFSSCFIDNSHLIFHILCDA